MSNYLLSDGDLNDIIATALHNDIIVATTPYYDLTKKTYENNSRFEYENINKLGLFSDLLKAIPVLCYDHPQVLEKFPNGMVTENAVFLPASLYEQIGGLKNEKEIFYKNENLSSIAFIEYLTQIIGHRLNKDFSEDLKTIIQQSIDSKVSNGYIENKINTYQQLTDNHKPQFISNESLANLCDSLNIKTSQTIRAWGNDTSFLDSVLINSVEAKKENHPFDILTNLTNPHSVEKLDINTSVAEFQKLYDIGLSPIVVPQALDFLNAINQQMLKDYPDINDYTAKLNEKYTPYLVLLNDKEFSIALEAFKNELGSVHRSIDSKSLKEIAININNYRSEDGYGVTLHQRDILIASISNFNNIAYDRYNPFTNHTNHTLENMQEKTVTHKLKN